MNIESNYRKWLYIEYRFYPEATEDERRGIAFRNLMRQIAHHCKCNGYEPRLFSEARKIRNDIYPHLIFDL